jgi:hypothetical protein
MHSNVYALVDTFVLMLDGIELQSSGKGFRYYKIASWPPFHSAVPVINIRSLVKSIRATSGRMESDHMGSM